MSSRKSQPRLATRVAKYCAPLLGAGSVFIASAANADTSINTIPQWDGTTVISAWGGGSTSTYGQTFTAPSSSSLNNFQFFTQRLSPSGSQPYNAYLYEWDTTALSPTGSALWSLQGLTTTGNGSLNSTVITVKSPKLTAGKQYVFFVSTVGQPTAGNPSFGFGATQFTDTYSGGDFVFSNDSASFTTAWDGGSGSLGDLAFLALFGPVLYTSSAQPYADIQSVGLDALKNQRELVLNQAGNCDQRGWVVYDSDKVKSTGKPKKSQSLCVFAEGGYATGSINGSDTVGGYNTNNASSAFGVEWKASQQWAIGAAYGYGTTNLGGYNFQDTSASIESNINSGNIYAVYRPDKHWKIAALGGYSGFSYSGSRTFFADTASSSFSANGYTAAIQASYDFILSKDYNNNKNPLNPVRVRPLIGLAWGSHQQGSFNEAGGGTLLNIQGQNTNSLMATIGASVEAPIPLNASKTTVLMPRAGVAYQYDFLANQNGNKSITAALQDDPSTSFTEIGQNRGINSVYLDLGADLQINPNLVLYAGVNYQAFTNGNQFGYQGGVRVKF